MSNSIKQELDSTLHFHFPPNDDQRIPVTCWAELSPQPKRLNVSCVSWCWLTPSQVFAQSSTSPATWIYHWDTHYWGEWEVLCHGKYPRWENIAAAHTCWWNVSYLLNLQGISEKYPGGEIEATTLSRETWSLGRRDEAENTKWMLPGGPGGRRPGCPWPGYSQECPGAAGGEPSLEEWDSQSMSTLILPCSPPVRSRAGSAGSHLLHCSFTLISILTLTREFT